MARSSAASCARVTPPEWRRTYRSLEASGPTSREPPDRQRKQTRDSPAKHRTKGGIEMSDVAAPATPAAAERGFTQLVYQLDDYPGPTKTALFGIQHVLVMFTAMVGGPLIVARLLNL